MDDVNKEVNINNENNKDQKSIDDKIELCLKELCTKFLILDNDKRIIYEKNKEDILSVKNKLLEIQEKMQQYIFQIDTLLGASEKVRIKKKNLVNIILDRINAIDNLFANKKKDSDDDKKIYDVLQVPEWQCLNTCPKFYQYHKNDKIYYRSKINSLNPKKLSIVINNRQLVISGIVYQSEEKCVSFELPSDYDNSQRVTASYNTEKNILEIIVPLR